MTGTEMAQRMEMEDRVQDAQEAVNLLDPEVGGEVFTRAECRVIASALGITQTASEAYGEAWPAEELAALEGLRQKACAGATR